MSELISVLYISRATFKPAPSDQGIEPHVGRILQRSRSNNAERGIGGVLFYGDGYFFQCLEGEAAAVRELMAVIRQDERHTDVKVVADRVIEQRDFGDWSMKYTSVNQAVKRFLDAQGFSAFNPFQFSAEHFGGLLQTLRQVSDLHTGESSGPAAAGLELVSKARLQQPGNRDSAKSQVASGDNLGRALGICAVILGLAALAIVLS